MRWSAFSLFGLLSLFAAMPSANAAGEDYGVLIISRERLEVSTSCEIGVYIQDQLSARLFQRAVVRPAATSADAAQWQSPEEPSG